MQVIELSDEQAEMLRQDLDRMADLPWRETLKVAVDIDGFKWKVGNGTWTPGFGTDLTASGAA
jgi:hypothetical protein